MRQHSWSEHWASKESWRSLQICTISLVRPDAQTKTVGGNFLLILLRMSYDDCIDVVAGRQTKEIAIVSESESLCNRTGNNQHSDLFEYSLCVFLNENLLFHFQCQCLVCESRRWSQEGQTTTPKRVIEEEEGIEKDHRDFSSYLNINCGWSRNMWHQTV